MTLSEKQIKEFRKLHKKVFGSVISKEQAMADGVAIIRLVSITQPKNGSAK